MCMCVCVCVCTSVTVTQWSDPQISKCLRFTILLKTELYHVILPDKTHSNYDNTILIGLYQHWNRW